MCHVRCGGALVVLLLVLVAAPSAFGHAQLRSGPYVIELGWAGEPAISGAQNAVQVAFTDAAGRPVSVPAGALSVQVTSGGAAMTLPLLPTETPGEARAVIVPTRAGTYAFRVTGRLDGDAIDAGATCSDRSFDCVIDATEVQFPAKDPSTGELARKLARDEPRAQQAGDTADTAQWIAIGAIVVAALALGAVLGRALSGRRGPDG